MNNERLFADRLIMTSHLKNVLHENGDNPRRSTYCEEIMDLLSPYHQQTVLCGGLVLQLLVGKTWPTDIDIFTSNTSIKSLPFGEWTQARKSSQYIQIPGVIDIYNGTIPAHGVQGSPEYCPPVHIDIIHISSLQELFLGFDFDFCKVWFDGIMIHVEDYESVRTRSCKVTGDRFLRKVDVRMEKYRGRGFTIELDESAQAQIQDVQLQKVQPMELVNTANTMHTEHISASFESTQMDISTNSMIPMLPDAPWKSDDIDYSDLLDNRYDIPYTDYPDSHCHMCQDDM